MIDFTYAKYVKHFSIFGIFQGGVKGLPSSLYILFTLCNSSQLDFFNNMTYLKINLPLFLLSGPFRFDVENIITPISKYRMYNQKTRTVRETMRYLTVHPPTRASSEEEKSSGTKYVRNEKLLVNCLRVKRQHSSQATRKWLHRRGPRWL